MIYENIRRIAKEQGYSIRDVEKALFFSNGVADFLNVDLNDLLGRKK